jgi:hypothetical protein
MDGTNDWHWLGPTLTDQDFEMKCSISTSTKRSKLGTANRHTLKLNKSRSNKGDERYFNCIKPSWNFHFQVLSRAGGWLALIATGKSFR